jgi:hypothetical protein
VAAPLSLSVERFLVDHVDSVAELETLVHLQANPDAEVGAEGVARALGVDAGWAADELERLAARGIVARGTQPGAFRFAPRTDELGRTIDEVLAAYRERRVTVISIITTKPSKHVLGFADAFRLRKD